jgi:class 3 adenylate cyclase
VVGAYLETDATAVTDMGGTVAKKLGDGLMALFGYPRAHENDAERAVRATLAIQRALVELNRKNAAHNKSALAALIGIETGPWSSMRRGRFSATYRMSRRVCRRWQIPARC